MSVFAKYSKIIKYGLPTVAVLGGGGFYLHRQRQYERSKVAEFKKNFVMANGYDKVKATWRQNNNSLNDKKSLVQISQNNQQSIQSQITPLQRQLDEEKQKAWQLGQEMHRHKSDLQRIKEQLAENKQWETLYLQSFRSEAQRNAEQQLNRLNATAHEAYMKQCADNAAKVRTSMDEEVTTATKNVSRADAVLKDLDPSSQVSSN